MPIARLANWRSVTIGGFRERGVQHFEASTFSPYQAVLITKSYSKHCWLLYRRFLEFCHLVFLISKSGASSMVSMMCFRLSKRFRKSD